MCSGAAGVRAVRIAGWRAHVRHASRRAGARGGPTRIRGSHTEVRALHRRVARRGRSARRAHPSHRLPPLAHLWHRHLSQEKQRAQKAHRGPH